MWSLIERIRRGKSLLLTTYLVADRYDAYYKTDKKARSSLFFPKTSALLGSLLHTGVFKIFFKPIFDESFVFKLVKTGPHRGFLMNQITSLYEVFDVDGQLVAEDIPLCDLEIEKYIKKKNRDEFYVYIVKI